MTATAYLAAKGFTAELQVELGARVTAVFDRLILTAAAPIRVAWAQNVWYDPEELPIGSISEAAALLRARQRNWVLYSTGAHRRAALIVEQLPRFRQKPFRFGSPLPRAPLGSWTLLGRDRLLAAARCRSPFAHGELTFVEDRHGPPSRAYLKLWEALTLMEERPMPGESCVDLGASPGGWTWALAELGASVLCVDKAPLAPAVAARANVRFRAESAFAFDPRGMEVIDWLCCDVICYPGRLLTAMERWLATGRVRRAIASLKFQGETDHGVTRAFAELPGSELVHLSHNKHELTFIWRAPPAGAAGLPAPRGEP
jgi:23S rRNA (cytidine2498-2'-O)-methyltransferase